MIIVEASNSTIIVIIIVIIILEASTGENFTFLLSKLLFENYLYMTI
jgi:hypothetical protein